jgi:zinc D-Ala-D-Ala carboxypeptidase
MAPEAQPSRVKKGVVSASYLRRIGAVLGELGVDPQAVARRNLIPFAEARRLVPVGLGTDGRDKMLAPDAAKAWKAMRAMARAAGVDLLLVSAFRSVDFQAELIRGKIQRGRSIQEVLQVNAPPGYSEHHTGCAVDVGFADVPPLDERFEKTTAFAWLEQHAARFGFSMSYPRGNAEGFVYEPWHWRYRKTP